MLLCEVFNTPVPFKLVSSYQSGGGDDEDEYKFTIDNIEYEASSWLDLELTNGGRHVREISFGIVKINGERQSMQNKFKVANTGNEYTVFSTIFEIVKDVLARHPLTCTIIVSASLREPSRVKLYDRLAKRNCPLGWAVRVRDAGAFRNYYFVKDGTQSPLLTDD